MVISPQRLTIYLYSAHRAVIFALAQLSCLSTFRLLDRTPKTTPILTLYQARAATLMPFSKEGTILILKNLYECEGYNARQFITEFPDKGWMKNSMVKSRKFGTVAMLIRQ